MRGRSVFWASFAPLLVVAGCLGDPIEPLGQADGQDAFDPVVVALIDTGVLPYFDLFQTGDDAWVKAAVGAPFESVELRSGGSVETLLEEDADVWNALAPGRLYHFAGTRVLGISFYPENPEPILLDWIAHGVVTTYLAAREAPNAVIVLVQVSGAPGCLLEGSCAVDPTATLAMEWLAEQPWIDVVSSSMGTPGNYPDRPERLEGLARYIDASEAASRSGKVMFNGAGNTVLPPLGASENGPPWIVTVGGFESRQGGEAPFASKFVDVVANWTEFGPAGNRGDFGNNSGTSFGTPVVAGTVAAALHAVREASPGRVVTPHELREALNASATFDVPPWDPVPPPSFVLPTNPERATLPIVAQPQMGWGYVDASLADEIARRVLESDFSIPDSKAQASLFQPEWQRAREEFWARWR